MPETTWIIDRAIGTLTVEGLSQSSLTTMTDEWLPPSIAVNCARPFHSSAINSLPILPATSELSLRVHRIYHHSVVEGPGRRSVLQVSGCERLCSGFIYSLEWANYDIAHERHKYRTISTPFFLLV